MMSVTAWATDFSPELSAEAAEPTPVLEDPVGEAAGAAVSAAFEAAGLDFPVFDADAVAGVEPLASELAADEVVAGVVSAVVGDVDAVGELVVVVVVEVAGGEDDEGDGAAVEVCVVVAVIAGKLLELC